MKNISLRRPSKDEFLGIRVTKQFKELVRREAWKRRTSISVLFESLLQDRKVKVSPESALSLRISSVESKLDRVLCLLEDRQQLPSGVPDVNSEIVQDAIRAHIMGDRGPMDALEKIWELQERSV